MGSRTMVFQSGRNDVFAICLVFQTVAFTTVLFLLIHLKWRKYDLEEYGETEQSALEILGGVY